MTKNEPRCKRCNQYVLLLTTPGHKPITLNPEPAHAGNVIISGEHAIKYRSLNSIQPAKQHLPRYVDHSTTCPNQPEQ